MATSRVVGTNENISTYGGVTRDYTSLATWEAATDNNLVSGTQSEVLECYDDAANFDDNITMAGAVTSALYFRIIRPADGEEHDGTPNNGVHFRYTGGSDMFDLDEDYASLQDVIIEIASTSNSNRICYLDSGQANQKAIGVLIKAADGGTSTARGFSPRGTNSICVNCLASNVDGDGFNPRANSSESVYMYNCTSANNGQRGFDEGGDGTHVAKNCLAHGNVDDDFDWNADWSGNNNASEDGTAGGTSSRINQTFTFVNESIDDYHLQGTDGGAKDFGADLSADGFFPFDDDIDFQTRSGSWDIGFDEFVAAGQPFIKRLGGVPYMRINKGVW